MSFQTNYYTRQSNRLLRRDSKLIPVVPATHQNVTLGRIGPNNQRALPDRARQSPYYNRVARAREQSTLSNIQQYNPSSRGSPLLPCSICFGEMHPKYQTNISFLPCGHVFCTSCIVSWISREKSCAICRKPTRESYIKPLYL